MTSLFEISTLDVVICVLFVYVVYKMFFKKTDPIDLPKGPIIEPLEKQDLTVEQLKKYNGADDPHICMAILGKIYEVTRGRDFYGPDGAYGALAGKDATRALGTMDLNLAREEYDDHADMAQDELQDAKEWAERLAFKYPIVGRLLAPGEVST